jgi:DNA replication protein DnaC
MSNERSLITMHSALYQHLVERGLLSQDASALTWICPTCGLIEPGRRTDGWFYRRLCPCQEEAQERRRRQEDQQKIQHALAEQRRALVYGWLGSDWPQPGLEDHTFATFEQAAQPEAFVAAQAWAARPQGTLLLTGDYGTGKTHLLAAIANHRRQRAEATLFASVVTLFDAIQDRIRHEQDYHELLRRAIATPLLILDDLDKPKPSDFRQELYYQIIDGRTRVHLPTALSCNCSIAELDRFIGGATRSRLMQGMTLVEMRGQDYRLRGSGRVG